MYEKNRKDNYMKIAIVHVNYPLFDYYSLYSINLFGEGYALYGVFDVLNWLNNGYYMYVGVIFMYSNVYMKYIVHVHEVMYMYTKYTVHVHEVVYMYTKYIVHVHEVHCTCT